MKFATLEGRRVAVWGYGREGRAALNALQRHLPEQAVTLFCRVADIVAQTLAGDIDVCTDTPDAETLASFDIVIKSPGISIYKPEIIAAQDRGTVFTSGTALWFGENPDARVVGITGTKGKSTTSALLAHLARALGVRTALAGNIGLPLLELDGQHADLWVVELSSFQTSEAGSLELGVVTSLYEEHLDWHGSRERYVADKLKLAEVSRTLLVNATQSQLLERTVSHPTRVSFGHPDGWHVEHDAAGQPLIAQGEKVVACVLPMAGSHNALNVCAALTALDCLGLDADQATRALVDFQPLPHRLQPLGTHGGVHWIDDSISTTPQAALAALESQHGQRIILILGGHDRGLDWSDFAARMTHAHEVSLITQGANGPRIAAALQDVGVTLVRHEVADLAAAVTQAQHMAAAGDTVMLSPGAPSFDQFGNYAERGRRFAEWAGFDSSKLGSIAGLGIH